MMSSKQSSTSDRVIFKSKPLTGIMADQYFDLATPEHFWCKRRFAVLQKFADGRIRTARNIAEIGCGNGVLQRQLEDSYNVAPVGFDLHEQALRQTLARRGNVYCYDIHDRQGEFHEAFDLLFMFDVLEHIADEDAFLTSARFHLARQGSIIINVPAMSWLFSDYDRVQGHQRRYSLRAMSDLAARNGFKLRAVTYWGGPLVSIVALRKAVLALRRGRIDSYSSGFDPRSSLINAWLYNFSLLERVPQRIMGTSVMAILDS